MRRNATLKGRRVEKKKKKKKRKKKEKSKERDDAIKEDHIMLSMLQQSQNVTQTSRLVRPTGPILRSEIIELADLRNKLRKSLSTHTH